MLWRPVVTLEGQRPYCPLTHTDMELPQGSGSQLTLMTRFLLFPLAAEGDSGLR